MGRIVVTEFISLDGVIEDPGAAEDCRYGAGPSRSRGGRRGTSSSSTSCRRLRPSCSAASPTKASPPTGKARPIGKPHAGTRGTAVSDHGLSNLIEASDDRGQMLDLFEVAEEDLRLISKHPMGDE